jgi:hypothetical protein
MIKQIQITDAQIDEIFNAMPDGAAGFLKSWGYRQFAQQLLALRAMPTWEPSFDIMVPGQEELVMQFCAEIAGPKGKPGRPPDPVRLLEMAEALYQVERQAAAKLPQPGELVCVVKPSAS